MSEIIYAETSEEYKAIKWLENKITNYSDDSLVLHYNNILYYLIMNLMKENKQLKEMHKTMAKYALENEVKVDKYKEVIEEVREYINSKVISNGEIIDQLRKIEVKELLQILDKVKDKQ